MERCIQADSRPVATIFASADVSDWRPINKKSELNQRDINFCRNFFANCVQF